MDSNGAAFPYYQPDLTPDWLDVQRKQQIAQLLMGTMQQTNQTPENWDSMRVVPKRSPLQSVATLASALLAGKGMNDAQSAAKSYYGKLYPTDPGPSTGPGAGIIDPNAPQGAQDAAQAVTDAPAGSGRGNLPQPAASSVNGPLGLPSLTGNPRKDMLMANIMGPKYLDAVAQRFAWTDQQKNDAAIGLTAPQRRMIALSDVKPIRGSSAIGSVDAYGNPIAVPIAGLQENIAARTGAEAAATAANTPHYEPDPFHPGHFTTTFPTPPASIAAAPGQRPASGAQGGGGAAAGGGGAAPNNAAALAEQQEGAKRGLDYRDKLAAEAQSALEGQRSLAEMGNLLQGFTPGAGAPMLAGIGSVAQALGVPADKVQKLTNMNVGDLQAFQRSSAALANAASDQISDPKAKAEFKEFLSKNPAWMMTPDGLKRSMDYMGRGFDAPLDKQQRFLAYAPKTSPDQWPNFESQWNAEERAKIAAGKYNSAPAALSSNRTSADVAKGPRPVYKEGDMATNPQTGEQLVRRNGQWVPFSLPRRPGQQ